MAMRVGLLVNTTVANLEKDLARAKELGFDTIQLGFKEKIDLESEAFAAHVKELLQRYALKTTQIRARWYGPAEWTLRNGPSTLALVPEAYRANRIEDILAWGRFAKRLDVPVISTHLGFLPMNPRDREHAGVVDALKVICTAIKRDGQSFLVETGQEHPVGLLRVFEDLKGKVDNLFINFDPANLIMYGNANGADWVRIFGKYITEVHAKDGDYPADGYTLGEERKIGEGKVDFPRFIGELKAIGFDGVLCIENQRDTALHASHITPEEREQELVESKRYLESLINA